MENNELQSTEVMEPIEKKKYNKVHLYYNFWMSSDDGQNVVTDQRLQLLIAINDLGTLRAAANHLKISYRKAWGDLKETEVLLGFPLIEKHRGGKEGGTTILTRDGKILIESYKAFRLEFQEAVDGVIRKFKARIKGYI